MNSLRKYCKELLGGATKREGWPFTMNPRPSDAPEPVLLIIADISGYTRYMTANAKTLAHSQTIITELIHAIVQQVELPLEVAKIEGDAVFLFSRKQLSAVPWPETRRIIGGRLLTFFHHFGERLRELSQSTTCTCNACAHIEELRLKIVAHSGEALFHRVLNFVELAGVDVIITHRLLKNSVEADQYLLVTEAARHDLEFPQEITLTESAETYDDIGRVNTLVYLPADEAVQAVQAVPAEVSFGKRFGRSWRFFLKLWLAPITSRRIEFRNISFAGSALGKMAFALLTVVLTPVYLPLGTAFVFFHALKSPKAFQQSRHAHEHKPDGSCCNGHAK